MKLSPDDRIQAKNWIQVHANGHLSLKNCTNPESENCTTKPMLNETASPVDGAHLANLIDQTHRHHVQLHNNNSIQMDALNSSIANLTTDVGKLSKQLGEQQQQQQHVLVQHVPQVMQEMAFILEPTHVQSIVGAEPLTTSFDETVKLVTVRESSLVASDGGNLTNPSNPVSGLYSQESTEASEVLHILTLAESNQTAIMVSVFT